MAEQDTLQETRKAASDLSKTSQKSLDQVHDASNQIGDHVRDASKRTIDSIAKAQEGTKTAVADVQKTIADAYGRSIQEWQDLSQRAFTLKTPKDFAAWQMDVVQHMQNNVAAMTEIYRSSATSFTKNLLPSLVDRSTAAERAKAA